MYTCRSPTNQYVSDFDVSGSPKIKSDGAVGLPMHDFLLEFNSKIYGLARLLYN